MPKAIIDCIVQEDNTNTAFDKSTVAVFFILKQSAAITAWKNKM